MITKTPLITAITLIMALVPFGMWSAPTAWSYAGADDPAFSSLDEQREEFHQTYPLTPNGRVSLENINGNVEIKVWDRAAVQVDAVKRAYSRERLGEAKIEVNSMPESLRIRTVYPDGDQTFSDNERSRLNNPATVEYSLTVPRKVRLETIELVNGGLAVDGVEGDVKASSINGQVKARGLIGETKLSTINGSLEATFTQLDETKPISLGSVNGNVVLIIPSDANAIIRAGTVHGAITNEFGLKVQHGEYVGHDLSGQLGTGGVRIKLGNVNGGISIRHAQDGRPMSSATSLLTDKDKEKDKEKEEKDKDSADLDQENIPDEVRREVLESQRVAREARRQAMADAAQQLRQAQTEAQREVERAIRESQREIQRAQMEIQRENAQQVREQMRLENRAQGVIGAGSGRGGDGRRYIDRESKTFAVSGQPAVNIVTFDGAVTVHGWDKQEVMYTAAKRAGDEEELKQIVIEAEQKGSSISIIAKSQENGGSVSLDVFVPRRSGLHVSTDDGRVNLEGVTGELTLRTGDGSIEVSDAGGQLQVNTGDGRIQVNNFEGQVDARTADGAIALDGKFTALAAQTEDGSITLTVPADANFTIETDAEDVNNEGLTISEDIAPSQRLKRWKVGRGGNVFVVKTGEGQLVLRTR